MVLAVDLPPRFTNTGTTDETFQQVQDLKTRVQLAESSGLHFFRTTTEIKSGPDASNESRFAMTFLVNLGVTEILCSFILVLERKRGKEIPDSSRLEFLEKFLANNFALSDAEDSTFTWLNWGSTAYAPLLRTLLAIHQMSSFWEMIESLVLLAHVNLAASRTLSQSLALLAYVNLAVSRTLLQ